MVVIYRDELRGGGGGGGGGGFKLAMIVPQAKLLLFEIALVILNATKLE